MLTDQLVNPTPFEVKIPYTAAVSIIIPPDGETKLNMQQMDDFRKGKPGSEETQKILKEAGCFLLDGDRGYDVQALEALIECVKTKKQQYRDFIDRFRQARATAGQNVTDELVEENLQRAGYGRISDQIEVLEKRIEMLRNEVKEADPEHVQPKLDPKRTCFVLEPPRQFASPTALKMFLAENPEIKEEHDKFMKAQGKDLVSG